MTVSTFVFFPRDSMNEFPLGYKVIPTVSWAYMASLLIIALYFKFNRVWSVRNLDLLLIISLAPGLLMVYSGSNARQQIMNQVMNRLDEVESKEVADAKSNENGTSKKVEKKEVEKKQPTTQEKILKGADLDPSVIEDDSKELPSERLNGKATGKKKKELSDEYLKDLSDTEKDDLLIADRTQRNGYICLFLFGGLIAIRMLLDPMMVRRPQLDPNMSFGGLTFLGVALLIFLFVNIIFSKPTASDMYGAESATDLIERRATDESENIRSRHGPGYALLHLFPVVPTFVGEDHSSASRDPETQNRSYEIIAKSMAITCQLAVVIGIFLIGWLHFNDARIGIGIAAFYLILPYTAQMTGRVIHVLPAALMVWSIVSYRRPLIAGLFVGLAAGVVYYPLFLLPLWLSFYWPRGRNRFLIGLSVTLVILALSLIFRSESFGDYVQNLQMMFGIWTPRMEGLQGIWALGWDSIYRLPILALFLVLSFAFALWPAQKNLGTLLSCSGAIMLVVQFWHGFGGGLLMAWYLPFVLMTIFRPNLEDRVATKIIPKKTANRVTEQKDESREFEDQVA